MTRCIGLARFFLGLLLVCSPVQAEREVTVAAFSTLAVAKQLQYPATVVNLQSAELAAEGRGRILAILAEVGDSVSQGQLLAKLECDAARIEERRAQAGLKRLQAARQLTRQQLERARSLASARSISQEELDQRQTQLNADRASIEEQQAVLEAARLQVGYCQISAPYSGTVIERLVSIGDYATPGLPLFELLQQDAVEIEAELPSSIVEQLRFAGDLQFLAGSQSYPLVLRSVLPVINAQSLQQPVRLRVTGDRKPPGGSFGRVLFDTPRHYLPSSYIQKRNGRFGVFAANNGRAVFIDLNHAEEGQAVATSLAGDTLIITSGLQHLADQQEIITQGQ